MAHTASLRDNRAMRIVIALVVALTLSAQLPAFAQEEPPPEESTEVPLEMVDEAPVVEEVFPPEEAPVVEAPPEAPVLVPVMDIPLDRINALVDALEIELAIPELVLLSVEPREWSDTSLGCPTPGRAYAQVIVPGYALVLSTPDGARTFEFHTSDVARSIVRC
jgi:hypothetical protein